MTSRLRSALLLGLAVGAIGATLSVTPPALLAEQSGGLHWLFALRGARPAPPPVAVISIDRQSAAALGLPADPARWPRSVHAQLVRALVAAGVRGIVFDVFFAEPGVAADDAALAAALREAGNVVLTGRLNKQFVALGRPGEPGAEAITVEVQPPAEPIGSAAFAIAPFSLPAWPAKLSQFWAFQEDAGDRPTLPVAALHGYAGPAAALLAREAGLEGAGNDALMQALRDRCRADPAWARALVARLRQRAASTPGDRDLALATRLAEVYAGPASYFLNFHGPPLSVATVPYASVIRGEAPRATDGRAVDLRDAVVFVGYAARRQPDQRDSFYSPFSLDTGLNLSGVEIAATATANLLENRPLRPLGTPAMLALLLAFGGLLGVVCRLLPGSPGIAAGLVSATLYLLGARAAFSAADLWVPVIVPVFVQTALAVVGALLLQFRHAREQRELIGAALGRYVPSAVVDRLAEEGARSAARVEVVHGTCMATDAAQYTSLAETLAPADLGELMNAYYELLFAEVEATGGQVSDVVGDAMMAIWASSRTGRGTQEGACRAALEIDAALARRTVAGERAALPTRIGLHTGDIRLGEIGARQHREYRAVGDIVNTAARIEGLNKLLGTRVLASAGTLTGLEGFVTREVGTFLLAGKSLPLVIHELRAAPGAVPSSVPAEFAAGLAAFRAGRWAEAERTFAACLAACPADGPSRYYAALCAEYQAQGATSFRDGAVRIEVK